MEMWWNFISGVVPDNPSQDWKWWILDAQVTAGLYPVAASQGTLSLNPACPTQLSNPLANIQKYIPFIHISQWLNKEAISLSYCTDTSAGLYISVDCGVGILLKYILFFFFLAGQCGDEPVLVVINQALPTVSLESGSKHSLSDILCYCWSDCILLDFISLDNFIVSWGGRVVFLVSVWNHWNKFQSTLSTRW